MADTKIDPLRVVFSDLVFPPLPGKAHQATKPLNTAPKGFFVSKESMSKLPDKPTNNQFMNASLSELGEWMRVHDTKTRLSMTCIYCGALANQTDHVIPTSRGGKNTKSNRVPCCPSCNQSKNNRTPEEWKGIDSSTIYFGSPRHLGMMRS